MSTRQAALMHGDACSTIYVEPTGQEQNACRTKLRHAKDDLAGVFDEAFCWTLSSSSRVLRGQSLLPPHIDRSHGHLSSPKMGVVKEPVNPSYDPLLRW